MGYVVEKFKLGAIWTIKLNLTLKVKIDHSTNNRDILYPCSKFVDPSLKGWWAITRTNSEDGWTQKDTGNDNTQKPKVSSGKKIKNFLCTPCFIPQHPWQLLFNFCWYLIFRIFKCLFVYSANEMDSHVYTVSLGTWLHVRIPVVPFQHFCWPNSSVYPDKYVVFFDIIHFETPTLQIVTRIYNLPLWTQLKQPFIYSMFCS